MASVAGDVGETEVRRMKSDMGLESEEVPVRGSDCEQPWDDSGPPSFRAGGATPTASPMAGGRARGDSCVSVRLSSCGFGPGVGAGPAEGRARGREG